MFHHKGLHQVQEPVLVLVPDEERLSSPERMYSTTTLSPSSEGTQDQKEKKERKKKYERKCKQWS